MLKTTITKTPKREYRYEKWYIYHNRSKGTKQRWCYLSKKYLELPEIKESIKREQATQNTTQKEYSATQRRNNLKLGSVSENRHVLFGGCRLAWSRLRDSDSRDPGSNPGSPTSVARGVLGYFAVFCLFKISLATITPETEAWMRPLVTPAPSPIAKRLRILVSRQLLSSNRDE